ncbi:MAG: hypothetical protein AAF843_05245 [Bacteroidota bacterium]
MIKLIGVLLMLLCSGYFTGLRAQIRFYAQYESLPFNDGFSSDFSFITGIRLDPNKELEVGVGFRGRFNPESLEGELRYSQSSFSLGFNYYHTRRLYYNLDVSVALLNDLLEDLVLDPLDFDDQSYFNYRINVNYIILRRLHFGTGIGLIDFSKLVIETGNDLLQAEKVELNLTLSLKLYLFQIKL